jgi:hypothetical protein
MFSSAELHVLYRIANSTIRPYPYPHIYVRDVFPADYYRELRAHLPPREAYTSLKQLGRVGDNYPDSRFVLPLEPETLDNLAQPLRRFWEEIGNWLYGNTFGQLILGKFGPILEQRFRGASGVQFTNEALLVQDYSTYMLGPHTDAGPKVLSFLFYLPEDDSLESLGTSVYVPRNRGFTCEGGPHYPFADFDRMFTMPYLPNSLFAFAKTPNSFHGVEPISEPIRRDLLLFDLKVKAPAKAAAPPAAKPFTV